MPNPVEGEYPETAGGNDPYGEEVMEFASNDAETATLPSPVDVDGRYPSTAGGNDPYGVNVTVMPSNPSEEGF